MLQSYLQSVKLQFYLPYSLSDKAALIERFVSYGIQRHYCCNRIVDTDLGADTLVCFLVDLKAPAVPSKRDFRFTQTSCGELIPKKDAIRIYLCNLLNLWIKSKSDLKDMLELLMQSRKCRQQALTYLAPLFPSLAGSDNPVLSIWDQLLNTGLSSNGLFKFVVEAATYFTAVGLAIL
jgi:hypothetical protein